MFPSPFPALSTYACSRILKKTRNCSFSSLNLHSWYPPGQFDGGADPNELLDTGCSSSLTPFLLFEPAERRQRIWEHTTEEILAGLAARNFTQAEKGKATLPNRPKPRKGIAVAHRARITATQPLSVWLTLLQNLYLKLLKRFKKGRSWSHGEQGCKTGGRDAPANSGRVPVRARPRGTSLPTQGRTRSPLSSASGIKK